MKQLQVEVVNVSAPVFTKTARGGYNIIEVAYKGQDGKISGKKLLDFANVAVYNQFLAVQPGDKFLVDTEKNEKGYYDWVKVGPFVEGASQPIAESTTGPTPSSGRGRVMGSTYETPEERATNRAAIIRQSTINMAIAYAAPGEPVKLDDLFTLAKK